MTTQNQPFVSVLTPVYNGAQFIRQCIDTVLGQTYQNYEYVIVNNCSKDGTLEIAREYSKKDSRIRIHDNVDFLPVIANHNMAFSQASPKAKYIKVISADDFMAPNCIEKMVELAEANPSVGIVGSYQLSGDKVRWQGFPYPQTVFPGRELCRRVLLGSDKEFGFGTPSSTLYRADLVRSTNEFYPNDSPHADTSACFKFLAESDYGFVHEILAYEITHQETQSYASAQINRYASAILNDAIVYGPLFLNEEELRARVKLFLDDYHDFLAVNYFVGKRDKKFWDYHEGRLKELGHPLKTHQLFTAAAKKLAGEVVNPGLALGKLWKYVGPKPKPAGAQAAPQTPPAVKASEPSKVASRSAQGGI